MNINIIYSCKDFVIAEKPHDMATAPLTEAETGTALNAVLELFPEGRNVFGKKSVEHGLVHRLDTATHGLFLVALNQQAFDNLWAQQQSGTFIKGYTAYCINQHNDDFPPCSYRMQKGLKIESLFRYFGLKNCEVRPVALDGSSGKAATRKAQSKIYETYIDDFCEFCGLHGGASNLGTIYKISCALKSGFKHQIRAHLAWLGYPIIGDKLYCPAEKEQAEKHDSSHNTKLELHATSLSFLNPVTSEHCNFSIDDTATFRKN